MKENLTRLYNTLVLIDTKGASTKMMAQCLNFIEGMIAELDAQEQQAEKAE